jgi:hypothetical protein
MGGHLHSGGVIPISTEGHLATAEPVGFKNSVRGLTGGFGWWLDTFAFP